MINSNGLTIVTGIKRSGTSAVMSALRESGIPVAGFKWPERIDSPYGESQDGGLSSPWKSDTRGAKHNPTGYWELISVIRGGLKPEHAGLDGEVVKVLVRDLPKSFPDLIKRVIFVMRNPLCVLRSRITCGEIDEGDTDKLRLHALTYINNITVCWKWLRDHLRPVKLVIYEELVNDPEKVMLDVCGWMMRGSPLWGAKVIEKSWNRSDPIKIEYKIAKELSDFYQLFVDRNFEEVYKRDLTESRAQLDKLYKRMLDRQNPQQNPKKEVAGCRK